MDKDVATRLSTNLLKVIRDHYEKKGKRGATAYRDAVRDVQGEGERVMKRYLDLLEVKY